MNEVKLFDTAREISLKIPGPSGMMTVIVRWPTDGEWCERTAAQRTVFRQLDKDRTMIDAPDEGRADLALLKMIRLDDGPALGEAEASAIIGRLCRSTVADAEMEGENYRIPLTVPGAETVHLLRRPALDQMKSHRRATARVAALRGGNQEMIVDLRPSGEFYDRLLVEVQGYAGAVPVIHKAKVVTELLRTMDELVEGDGSGF